VDVEASLRSERDTLTTGARALVATMATTPLLPPAATSFHQLLSPSSSFHAASTSFHAASDGGAGAGGSQARHSAGAGVGGSLAAAGAAMGDTDAALAELDDDMLQALAGQVCAACVCVVWCGDLPNPK
jgi:hypothetical protein